MEFNIIRCLVIVGLTVWGTLSLAIWLAQRTKK